MAVKELGLTQRRACRLVGIARSVARYRRRSIDPPGLRERLRALAAERRRYGYRRLWILLRREDFLVNHKRVYRLYREEGLMVQRRGSGCAAPPGSRGPFQTEAINGGPWTL